MADGFEPIEESEILYRRALTKWFEPARVLSPQAFRPTEDDTDGLSLWRAKHVTIEDAAKGRKPPYYVATVRASDILALGLQIDPDKPGPTGQRGHCVIPQLDYARRKESRSLEWQIALARKAEVEGPFGSGRPEATADIR